jgi:nucleotide-binding universal stress UspA family protein
MYTRPPQQRPEQPSRRRLLSHIILPIASPEDAEQTCMAVLPDIQGTTVLITAVHVIEMSSGWASESAPREYRHEWANEALEVVVRYARGHGIDVDKRVIFEHEVTAGIIRLAEEVDASAIVFTPRGSGRLRSLFSTGVAFTLVKKATRPVIVFPR